MSEYTRNYEYITTQDRFDESLKWLNEQPYFVFDIETGPSEKYKADYQKDRKIGLDPLRGSIYTMQYGNRFQQYILDMRCGIDVSGLIKRLEDENVSVLGTNLRFDTKYVMHHLKCIPRRLVDIMIMEQIIRCGLFSTDDKSSKIILRYTSMKALAKRYLSRDLDKDKAMRMDLWKNDVGCFSERELNYMADDCIIPDLVARKQKPLVLERGLSDVVQLEHSLIPVVANMELTGIPFNKEMWVNLLQNSITDVKIYEDKLDKLLGAEVMGQEDLFGEAKLVRKYDYSSSKQLAHALDDAGVKGFVAPDGEVLSTSSDKIVLMKIEKKINSELADAITGYRKVKKKVDSYGTNFLKAAHPLTGRIHPDFTQCLLVTGRMSCSPGMQTIPGSSIYRAAFDSPKGYTLIILDASQIEARISADLTNDEPAIKVFLEGKDIYKADGELMFNREIIRGTEEGEALRARAKVSWLGLSYGQGKPKFNRYCRLFLQEDIPKEETDFLFDKFFEIHWRMKEVMDEWSASVDPLGGNDFFYDNLAERFINPEKIRPSLTNIFKDRFGGNTEAVSNLVEKLLERRRKVTYTNTRMGRKRFFRSDFVGWWTAGRNAPIQGLAADIQKYTMLEFQEHHWKNDIDANIINVVHDEIITLVREDQAEQLLEDQIRIGTEVGQKFLNRVPMKIEGGISKQWKKF